MKIYNSRNKKSQKYNTVSDLREALNKFPDDYPLHMFMSGDDNIYIRDVADYDDKCQIELI